MKTKIFYSRFIMKSGEVVSVPDFLHNTGYYWSTGYCFAAGFVLMTVLDVALG